MRTSVSDRIGGLLLRLVGWAGMVFLALPLVVIVGASFTDSEFLAFPPQGLTLRWYQRSCRTARICTPSPSAPGWRWRPR